MEEEPQREEGEEYDDDQKKIRVALRIRPLIATERQRGETCEKLRIIDDGDVEIACHAQASEKHGWKRYRFDKVLGPNSTQDKVFQDIGIDEMVEAVLNGFDATVFAYGQTGSGKTFTMEGDLAQGEQGYGIAPRAITTLFSRMEKEKHRIQARVRCSYIQIYNEKVFDLLSTSSKPAALRMRYDTQHGFYLENLFIFQCSNAREVLEHFTDGAQRKIMASHALNANSSRSHSMFTIHCEVTDPTKPPEEATVSSKLSLVDLAGSERVSVTKAKGETFKEATNINKSLFVLRKVITALADSPDGGSTTKRHVPYRDSKLTSLLQHSLGGSSLTVMIACLSPSDVHESENLSTMAYASQAGKITNRPTKNEDAKTKRIRALTAEVKLLRAQLANAQNASLLALQTNKANLDSDSKHPSGHDKLKRDLLESIAMIKTMYAIEKEMRQRMEEAESQVRSLQLENQKLLLENQEIREREQMLLQTIEDETDNSMARKLLQLQRANEILQDQVISLRAVTSHGPPSKHTKSKKKRIGATWKPLSSPLSSKKVSPHPNHQQPGFGHLSVDQLRHLLLPQSQERRSSTATRQIGNETQLLVSNILSKVSK